VEVDYRSTTSDDAAHRVSRRAIRQRLADCSGFMKADTLHFAPSDCISRRQPALHRMTARRGAGNGKVVPT
jgi:hypothetical protein